ncbi:hypothetical protein Taro_001557, partial [Colocasia esculenta]|nr:hypothetical protein [Colocasia esculenta]
CTTSASHNERNVKRQEKLPLEANGSRLEGIYFISKKGQPKYKEMEAKEVLIERTMNFASLRSVNLDILGLLDVVRMTSDEKRSEEARLGSKAVPFSGFNAPNLLLAQLPRLEKPLPLMLNGPPWSKKLQIARTSSALLSLGLPFSLPKPVRKSSPKAETGS